MLPVFGHRNPDTDAIASALVYARFLQRQGIEAQAFRLGELNFETQLVLRELKIDAPEMLPVLKVGTEVALVDHNELGQSASNLSELKVKYVVDHHKLGDLETAEPLLLRFEPLGCTGTILLKMHREVNMPVEPQDARLMLSAILSDTLHFRSPTTTDIDREAVAYLAPIAGVQDVEAYALAMFAAKSDLGDTPAADLLKMDYKVFPFSTEEQWGIGVLETTNPAYVMGRKDELLSAMTEAKAQDGLQGMLLCVVDILNENNQTFVPSDTEAKLLKAAFGAETKEQMADLGKVISRKKQIVPPLKEYFAQ